MPIATGTMIRVSAELNTGTGCRIAGVLEGVFVNQLGQTCYRVYGQVYSDPIVSPVCSIGQWVTVRREEHINHRPQTVEYQGQVLECRTDPRCPNLTIIRWRRWDETQQGWIIEESRELLTQISPTDRFDLVPQERAIVPINR